MVRPRNPNRDKAKQLWIESDKSLALVDIAAKLGCSPSQVRKWKSQDRWDDEVKGSAPIEKERYQTMKSNGNAVGNKGNKNASPPKRNNNALKHGLYAKYLPGETYELAEAFDTEDPADLLWRQITTTHALILQTHKIMHVTDNEDHSKEVSGWSSGEGGSSETYALQYAWDKHANYINTITRATNSLSNLIKQFVSLADEQDERRKKLELMDAQIRKVQSEADIIENKASKLVLNEKEQSKVQGLIDIGQALIGPIEEDEESERDESVETID
ncbi:phage terminase small subunit [Enterococcus casseliflavus]|uniref:phage terminase small subunit n=1 Tax=Enterococcus casseliflavus TaxID=37734 RepID=UPI00232B45C2|nr:phage terminase small subunit [Enterococcus casseliflavus]MDB1689816.1 phage terminase small subunit [Enterococcus casseliflavus]